MYDSNESRRDFLRYASTMLATGLWGSIGGCDRGTKPPTQLGPKTVKLYGTGTLNISEDGWKELERDAGITLLFNDNGNDVGPVIAQMLSGTAARDFELGGLQGGAERELAKAGAIIPWDVSKLSNWATRWDMVDKIDYIRVDGQLYGLPVALNADSMIYLPESIKGAPGYESGLVDSYFAVFDERLKGRTSMEDAWINSVIFTAIYLKQSGGAKINKPGDLTEPELKEVMAFLIDLKKKGQFRKLWRGWEQGVELLATGEVWVMTGWEPIVYELKRRNVKAEYAIPKEGYEGWSNDLILHAGAKEKHAIDDAHRVANWLLNGFYGCKLAELRGYAVPNESSIKFAEATRRFDSKKVSELSSHVRGKFTVGSGETFWQNVRPANFRLYEEWWSRLRNA